jgi:putative protease
MLEILSPAGSPEGVVAAVQNGADAVYLGFGDFNARRNAKNFTPEDFRKSAEYCRVRGVKVYVTFNTLTSDREMAALIEQARLASRYGADAFIVQDLGVLRALRKATPDIPIHASTQMGVHNLEGVKLAAAMGVKRVVLARELTREEIAAICKNSPIETEVFVHGALCMSHSGQCYMSAVIGRRSGNRGLCAQPCRLNYSTGGHDAEYLLSLKDNCLVSYVEELEKLGVTSLKIEGRMRRPEYAAIVTGVYARAAHQKKPPTAEDMRALTVAFSRQGFTDGYYTGRKGRHMFGVREEESRKAQIIFATARKNYLNGEFQRVPVKFAGSVKKGEPVRMAAADDWGNSAQTTCPIPEPAFHRALTPTILQTQLHKTGGTPFYCDGVKSTVEEGLSLSAAAINEMRRDLLAQLVEQRRVLHQRQEGEFIPPLHIPNREDKPVITLSVLRAAQLSEEMADLKPHMVYIPLEELTVENKHLLEPFLGDEAITLAVRLPRVIFDGEKNEVASRLEKVREMGIKQALVGNIGHIQFVKSLGFSARGDYGLNLFNSTSVLTARDIGLSAATLSFELRFEQIRDLSKPLDTEIIVYGRLPLMLLENCIIKGAHSVCACDNVTTIKDRQGESFPVVREYPHRNVVLNSKKLFLADKMHALGRLGVWGTRLMFTTENAVECVAVLRRYMGLGDYEPGGFTRGLYTRGVE